MHQFRQPPNSFHACEMCGEQTHSPAVGRPRRYCSNRCRAKAHRCKEAVTWLHKVEQMKADLDRALGIDWTDEDHRVA